MAPIRLYEFPNPITEAQINDILAGRPVGGKQRYIVKSRHFDILDEIVGKWTARHLSDDPDEGIDIYTVPVDDGNHLLAILGEFGE